MSVDVLYAIHDRTMGVSPVTSFSGVKRCNSFGDIPKNAENQPAALLWQLRLVAQQIVVAAGHEHILGVGGVLVGFPGHLLQWSFGCQGILLQRCKSVSYTHLTLPTKA